ncbi:PREDICTED: homeobox protein Hox-C6-like, partial [Sturnus vulgaris]|uniref:homeobox protein Hox-C6-like n=1 Tax=Sturnus vulgaris TaxID=9172 RepID=UPI00071A2B2A
MNSYFPNASLSCHLGGAQDVVPNVAINAAPYDAVRHLQGYGSPVAPSRLYPAAPFYPAQESSVVFGSRSPYDYSSAPFYPDKESAPGGTRQSPAVPPPGAANSLAHEFGGEQNRAAAAAAQEHKAGIQIYPWMQRMNSHS